MSYAGYFASQTLNLPKGLLAVSLGLYTYLNFFSGRPALWSEWRWHSRGN